MNKEEQMNYIIKNNCNIEGFNLDIDSGVDIEYWANYCRSNPLEAKQQHSKFINSIYEKHVSWKKTLLSKSNGVKILSELYNIRNPIILYELTEKSKQLQKK
jgi:hypothetical protein